MTATESVASAVLAGELTRALALLLINSYYLNKVCIHSVVSYLLIAVDRASSLAGLKCYFRSHHDRRHEADRGSLPGTPISFCLYWSADVVRMMSDESI